MSYIRNDIYYCRGCGQFFDDLTDKLVEVSYTEMPAEFALEVMKDRQKASKVCHSQKRAKRRSRPQNRGFGK